MPNGSGGAGSLMPSSFNRCSAPTGRELSCFPVGVAICVTIYLRAHRGSAERERKSLHARSEKLDLKLSITDGLSLSNQLMQPLFDNRAVALGSAVLRVWRAMPVLDAVIDFQDRFVAPSPISRFRHKEIPVILMPARPRHHIAAGSA